MSAHPHALRGRSRYWVAGYPDLVREWDNQGNGDLTPDALPAGSGRRVWWKCPKGSDHRWRAKPNNRTYRSGCPFCANKRVSVTNSLETRFPDIAKEWDEAQNGDLSAAQVTATTTRVVFWRCHADPRHVWRRSVRDRTRDRSACPFCSNDRPCDTNSLFAKLPLLAREWHEAKNLPLTPALVTPGSSRRVWWQCHVCAHEWCTSITNRALRASGCPLCARRDRTRSTTK